MLSRGWGGHLEGGLPACDRNGARSQLGADRDAPIIDTSDGSDQRPCPAHLEVSLILVKARVFQGDDNRTGRDPGLGVLAHNGYPLADGKVFGRTIPKFLDDRIAGQVHGDGAIQGFDRHGVANNALDDTDPDNSVLSWRGRVIIA